MNTLIIIILVAVVALQIIQLKKITKLTREVEALRDERNINTEATHKTAEDIEPVADERTMAMNVVEPTPAVEEVAEVAAEPEKEEPEHHHGAVACDADRRRTAVGSFVGHLCWL